MQHQQPQHTLRPLASATASCHGSQLAGLAAATTDADALAAAAAAVAAAVVVCCCTYQGINRVW
jgi:hypothetical protein